MDNHDEDREAPADLIARKTKERDAIIAEYGHGIRPSYVSADLAALDSAINQARAQM